MLRYFFARCMYFVKWKMTHTQLTIMTKCPIRIQMLFGEYKKKIKISLNLLKPTYPFPKSDRLRLVFPTLSCPTSITRIVFSLSFPSLIASAYARLPFFPLASISSGTFSSVEFNRNYRPLVSIVGHVGWRGNKWIELTHCPKEIGGSTRRVPRF